VISSSEISSNLSINEEDWTDFICKNDLSFALWNKTDELTVLGTGLCSITLVKWFEFVVLVDRFFVFVVIG
jgi:hypothetical protein